MKNGPVRLAMGRICTMEPSDSFSEDRGLVGVGEGAAVRGRGGTFYSSRKAWKSASKDK